MRGKYQIFQIKNCKGVSVPDDGLLEVSSNDLNIIHKKLDLIKSRISKKHFHSIHCIPGYDSRTFTAGECRAEFEMREVE